MKTPVAFLIFRRPEQTRRVFAEIARARPPHLLVVADGPRHAEERAVCEATRAIITQGVDWPCRVETLYAGTNLGCRRRVSSGLDWVFSRVEEAIILEDDCLPHPHFFPFCEELLARYRNDPRIGHIGGMDYNQGAPRGDGSYYFSRYTSIWGWASWRRAWQQYDVDMREWPSVRQAGDFRAWFGTAEEAEAFLGIWDDIHAGTLDTWDGQWLFCRLRAGSLAVAPNGNLISNMGCGDGATHTTQSSHPFAALPLKGLSYPLVHPSAIVADVAADADRARKEFLRRPDRWSQLQSRLRNKHWYGAWVRRLPMVGACWKRLRQ